MGARCSRPTTGESASLETRSVCFGEEMLDCCSRKHRSKACSGSARWVVMFGRIFSPGALFWSSGPWTRISADPKTPRAYRDDQSLASSFRVKGVRQARQTATRLSRIQVNAGLRVVGESSWRLLCPPPPRFSPRDCGAACHQVMESEEAEWFGAGSIRYRYFDVSSLSGEIVTLHCVNSGWHQTRKCKPYTLSVAAQQRGRRFSSSRCCRCLVPLSKASLGRKRSPRISCALKCRGEEDGSGCGVVGIGWRGREDDGDSLGTGIMSEGGLGDSVIGSFFSATSRRLLPGPVGT